MSLAFGIIALSFTAFMLGGIFQRHRGVTRWVFVEVVYNLVIKCLVGYLGFPSILNYGSDLILVIILFKYLYLCERFPAKHGTLKAPGTLIALVMLYFVVCVMSTLINESSLLLFVWGFRNNFRFLIMLLACSASLNENDFYELNDILFAYLMLNVPVVMNQSRVMSTGYGNAYGDYVSGLFGNGLEARGGNASLNWLMSIVCTFDIVRYLNSEQKLWRVLLSTSASLYISAVSELKLFMVDILIIAVLSLVFARKSYRTVLVAALVTAEVFVAIQMLYLLFPKFNGFFTWEGVIDYATRESGYSRNRGAINRLNSLWYVFTKYLQNPTARVFGIGLGNADYSSRFSFLTSEFYRINSWTAYQWLSVPMILIETGILGLICYGFFALDIIRNIFRIRSKSARERSLLQISLIMVVLAIISAVSNQSLRMEAMGFTVWLFLSMPYVVFRRRRSAKVKSSKK